MDLGINWFLLLSQIAVGLAIPVLIIGLASFLIRAKKPSKILVGFLTAWVIVYSVVFSLVSFFTFRSNLANFYDLFSFLNLLTMLWIVFLLAYYFFHVAKSPFLSEKERLRYQAGFLFFPLVVMPLYYWKFIRNEPVLTSKT